MWLRSLALALLLAFAAACDDPGGPSTLPADASDGASRDAAEDVTEPPDGAADAPDREVVPAPVRSPRTVRVATWNVRRLFDTTCDTGQCGGWNDYEELPTAEEFAYKVGDVATQVAAFGADVVILQEIETKVALDAVVAALPDASGPWQTAYLGETGGDKGTVDVAVLARFPMIEAKHHRKNPIPLPEGGTTTFAREFLEVHLHVPDADGDDLARVIVFAAHFKAKSNDDPDRRLAEAMAAEAIVSARATERPDAMLVLGGDLNDYPGSPPLVALEGPGNLVRVAADLEASLRWTYRFNGQEQAIDHLFLATGASGAYVPRSAWVKRDHPNGLGSSDHAALVADFLF